METHGGGRMMVGAETGAMRAQAKQRQGLPATACHWTYALEAPEGAGPADALASQTVTEYILSLKASSLWQLTMAVTGKQCRRLRDGVLLSPPIAGRTLEVKE